MATIQKATKQVKQTFRQVTMQIVSLKHGAYLVGKNLSDKIFEHLDNGQNWTSMSISLFENVRLLLSHFGTIFSHWSKKLALSANPTDL